MRYLILILGLLFSVQVFGQRTLVTDKIRMGGQTVDGVSIDTTLNGASNSKLVTEGAVKAYVDNNSGGGGTSGVGLSNNQTITGIKSFNPSSNTKLKIGANNFFNIGYQSGYARLMWFADYNLSNEITSTDSGKAKIFGVNSQGYFFNEYENAGVNSPVGAETRLFTITNAILSYKGDKVKTYLSRILWAVFGDSFSTSLTGDYLKEVSEKMSLTNANISINAVAGNTIFAQVDTLDNVLSNDPNYFDDKDIVSFLIGANDYAQNSVLGTVADTANAPTFAGQMKYFIETVLTAKPSVKLFIMTPTKANGSAVFYTTANTAGWKLEDLANLVVAICKDYSVPCIDLYSNAGFNLQTIDSLTVDGLHPSLKGRIKISDIVVSAFESGVGSGGSGGSSGSSSGGDAETLDGQAPSYYLNYTNFTNTPTINNYWTLNSGYLQYGADSVRVRNDLLVSDGGKLLLGGLVDHATIGVHTSGGLIIGNTLNISNTAPLLRVQDSTADGKFEFAENGQLRALKYGSQTFTGTVETLPAFASNGDLIEMPKLLDYHAGEILTDTELGSVNWFSNDQSGSGAASGRRAYMRAYNASGGAWNGNLFFEDVDFAFGLSNQRVLEDRAVLTHDGNFITNGFLQQKTSSEYSSSTKFAVFGGTNNEIIGFRTFDPTVNPTLANVLASGNSAGDRITNVTDPTSAQDAATKAYVDGKVVLDGLVEYADEAAAIAGGVAVGEWYKTPFTVGSDTVLIAVQRD